MRGLGRRSPEEYVYIEAILRWDPRRGEARLSPAPGQRFPVDMKIECSKRIRLLPLNTRIRLKVVVKYPKRDDDASHLYSSYKWLYEVL